MERKLTAILYADVAGYSRLTGVDEEGTVEILKVHLGALTGAIEGYGGRIVNTAGDAVLAEFASVVAAVNCAAAAQRDLTERNKCLPENRKLQFRVGVNLGDVVVDGAEIYGDGVNVAARLEALADPGGMCVSRTVFNHVKGKVDFGFEYLGEKKVKNIEEPVETYRVLLDPEKAGQVIGGKKPQAPERASRWQWAAVAAVVLVIAAGSVALWLRPWAPDVEPASVEKMAFPLPEQPSIGVLPFDNMSDDPAVDYLADGLTEEIITTLSKVPDLMVIARNSSFIYKGKPVPVKQVAEEQGVRYVLEGSVQRSGNRIRINAQLIDALKGTHVWAERYDRDLTDLFALQDDITQNIMVAMQVQLTDGEQARLRHARAPSAKAFEYQVKARAAYRRFTKEDNRKARELAEKATELAPNFAIGWGLQGVSHNLDGRFGWSESRKDSFEKAIRFAEKALSIDPELPEAFSLLGSIHLNLRQHDQAVTYAQKAVDLSPNHATMVANLAHILSYSGRPQEAIPLIRKAMRLSPYYPAWYVSTLGLATMMTGQYDESIPANEETVQRKTLLTFAYSRLAGMHAQRGDMEKARSYAADLMKIKPDFNLESWAKVLPYKNPDDLERELAMLRKAGFPEKPPLPLPDKPSIAVLPFDNLSGDPEDQFLADGLTEDIITTLSRVPSLFVIARNSTFTYKGKPVKVQQVASELGVRYVLEGSLQRSGERLRVTAQLIDATTGHHLWADRFDRKVDDIFALQDEIAHKILIELQVKLVFGEHARVSSRGTKSLEAWLLRNQAFAEGSKYTKEGMLKARELYRTAVDADPGYARAWGGLAWTDYFEARMGGWDRSREDVLSEGVAYAKQAKEVDPREPVGYSQLANLFAVMGAHDQALAYAQQAAKLASNDYQSTANLAVMYVWAGESERAIDLFEQAKRLSPKYPAWIDWILGLAQLMANQNEEAIATLKEVIKRTPKSVWPRGRLVAGYAALDRLEEAKAEATALLKIQPGFKVSRYVDRHLFKDPTHKELLRDLLLKAGLPD